MSLTLEDFLAQLTKLGIASRDEVQAVLEQALSTDPNSVVRSAAMALVRAGKVTEFQAQSLLEGKLIAIGPYLFEDKLADGGMGQVFLARHRTMGRRVAVKIIHEKQVGSRRAAARFQREIQALASLQHPNIVTAFDAGEENGVAYLAMEFIEGRNLAQEVKLRGRLPVNAALEYTRQAAIGLQYIHQEGIIHRDIKPSNLLLERSGTIKILDLGLSRWADWRDRPDPESTVDVTVDGEVIGTFDFMAPEQFANLREVDQRSDIFSLGCTLYFLLHGKSPFAGVSAGEKLLARRELPMPTLGEGRPDVGPELERIFERMVARNPQERFSHAQELLKALRSIQEKAYDVAETVALASPSLTPPAPLDSRQRSKQLLAAGALCAVLVSGVFWLFRQGDDRREQPLPPVEPVTPPEQVADADDQQPTTDDPTTDNPATDDPATEDPATIASNGEVESPESPSQPPLAEAVSEQAAAEWVVAHGGMVDIARENEFLAGLATTSALPPPPFTIARINLADSTFSRGELRAISGLSELSWLELSRSSVQDEDLESLSRLPRLETLHLSETGIDNDGLKYLALLPALRNLDLRGTQVTDDGLEQIARCPVLDTLMLGERPTITDRGLEHLRSLQTLTSLTLRGTKISDAGLEHLAELKSLVWLDLGNSTVGDLGLMAIQGLPLRTLLVDGTRVTDEGAALFRDKNCEVIR